MASNMMEILKQIQRDLADQKEFMTVKFNLMEGKIDQQQDNIQKLKQQIKRNNGILFGNEETETVEDTNTMLDKPVSDNKEMEGHLLEQYEKCIDNFEVNQLHSELKVTKRNEKECNYKDENDDASIKFSEHSNIIKVAEEDKKEGSYEGDTDKKYCKIVNYGECLANEMREIKELIRDHITTRKASVEETASPLCKQVTAKQTNFSADQIKVLNENLNKIAKKYESNIEKIIELLCTGVSIKLKKDDPWSDPYIIKLGMTGFKRSEVLSLIIEYPNLSISEVVRERLYSTNQWNHLSETYNVYRVYNNHGGQRL